MLFAGLWERNEQVAAEPLQSFSILTREAEGEIAALHDRMPLALQPDVLGDWLTGSAEAAVAITAAAPAVNVECHPERREVGNVHSQGGLLIAASRY